jgi:hypothetical protein
MHQVLVTDYHLTRKVKIKDNQGNVKVKGPGFLCAAEAVEEFVDQERITLKYKEGVPMAGRIIWQNIPADALQKKQEWQSLPEEDLHLAKKYGWIIRQV